MSFSELQGDKTLQFLSHLVAVTATHEVQLSETFVFDLLSDLINCLLVNFLFTPLELLFFE